MSKTCPRCGANTVADARFCRACGTALTGNLAVKDAPTEAQLSTTTSFTEKRAETDGLSSEESPSTASFNTVIDHSPPEELRRPQSFDPKATQFDPRATQFDARTTQYSSSNLASPDSSSLTSSISPQPTVNLSATVPVYPASETVNQEKIPPPEPPTPTQQRSAALPQQQATIPETRVFTAVPAVTQAPAHPSVQPPPPVAPYGHKKRHTWLIALAIIVPLIVLGGLVAASLLAWRLISQNNLQTAPTPLAEKKSATELLAEAESLLASGDLDGAIERLRGAVRIEPANASAYRQLGDLLSKRGDRAEALEAYRLATENNSKDAAAWRSLAEAQFDEGLYADSVESYRKFIAVSGSQPSEDTQLALADALRSNGAMNEAKAYYEKLSLSGNEEIASSARQRLSELSQIGPQVAVVPDPTRAAKQTQTPAATETPPPQISISEPTPVPTPPVPAEPPPTALTPTDHYRRGVELWGSNRAAAVKEFLAARSIPDASYYLGLNIAEGRDPAGLGRADLVSALYYFQVAQRGPHGAQAQRYVEILGKEYDRRRISGQ